MTNGEQFDFSDYDVEFSTAGGRDRNEKFVPQTGPVTARVNSLKMKSDSTGTPTLQWAMTILDGANVGETLWRKNRIVKGDAKSMSRLNSDLLTAGLKVSSLNELNEQEKLDTLKGTVLAVSVKVTDPAKGYYDVFINRRIVGEDEAMS